MGACPILQDGTIIRLTRVYKMEDFRRSGTPPGGVREGSGTCVHLGEAWVAFFGAYRRGNENLVRRTLSAA